MNDLTVFENNEFGAVRTTAIDGEPWLVGKDVADALGYKNTNDALLRHVDEEDKKVEQIVHSIGGSQETIIINESGLYSLIFSSQLESAKKFKRWVTSEVLPSIRKTGKYDSSDYNISREEFKKMINTEAERVYKSILKKGIREDFTKDLMKMCSYSTITPEKPELTEAEKDKIVKYLADKNKTCVADVLLHCFDVPVTVKPRRAESNKIVSVIRLCGFLPAEKPERTAQYGLVKHFVR